jgi:hypothetical protein
MMFALRRHPVIHAALWLSLAASLWLVASVPSGFSIAQIAMFIGPGIVLAIAASWASHAAFPQAWTWQHGARAAAIGAGTFPPFVALFFAWAGTFGSNVLVMLLVLSAWLAMLFGLIVALARLARAPRPQDTRMFPALLKVPSALTVHRMTKP